MGPAIEAVDEPREISGLTTGLVLSYVEAEGGHDAVEQVLEHAGLSGREAELRDVDCWFADARRIALFEAAAVVLGDSRVARKIGRSALEHNLGTGLKLSLRALGSPRLVYSNISRANAKFTAAYEMESIYASDRSATLRNVRKIDGDPHSSDCEYNIGLLSTVPSIFGLQAARVRHSTCVHNGAPECRYEVTWQSERATKRWIAGGVGAVGTTALLAPAILPISIAAVVVASVLAGRELLVSRAAKVQHLERSLNEETEAAALMTASLKELVSELEVDELLERIPRHAHSAASGAEFALMVGQNGQMRCRGVTDLADEQIIDLERWASGIGAEASETITIDDLSSLRGLGTLAGGEAEAFGSLCAAPMRSHGRTMGFLVALFAGARSVLPRDIIQLESYAALAAIALQNATLFETQRDLAIRDSLTGLLNHSQLHELLETEIARAQRGATKVGVALFDLNHFKQVNDSFGHAVGDELLRGVGGALKRSVRGFDQVFRIGGDEFAMIVAGGDLEQTTTAALRAAGAIGRTDPRASACWGVASWPQSGLDREAVLAAADSALYAQKGARATDGKERAPVPARAGGWVVGAGSPAGGNRAR